MKYALKDMKYALKDMAEFLYLFNNCKSYFVVYLHFMKYLYKCHISSCHIDIRMNSMIMISNILQL
jgi:hypothetical protein